MLESKVRRAVEAALTELFPEAAGEGIRAEVETPRDKTHGDFATNVAMALARPLKKAPRAIAGSLVPSLAARTDLFAEVTVAGPGFINLRLAPPLLHEGLGDLLQAGSRWGESDAGGGARVQVEFVSANPTGPLNVVNARAAAYGATLARLLAASGHRTETEFYVNDVGGQIDLLGASLLSRYAETRGEPPVPLPEGGYQGEYLLDLARDLDPDAVAAARAAGPEGERTAAGRLAVDRVLDWQKRDLADYGTTFDRWFRQSELYPEAVDAALARLVERGQVEDRDGARWFPSTRFGDDQDRVVVRATGEPTYFLADLAYHATKFDRGYTRVIDIWGPDHHGYIGRMQAAMEALGYGTDWLEILIVQQVNLLAGGKPAKMSKRRGEFITLRDLIDEVGKDTATFFFLMRRAESHLDFDIELAKKTSDENPVYYVKYAHARISGLLRKAEEEGVSTTAEPDRSRLVETQELDLLKILLQFPSLIAGAAAEREPHRLTNYLREVAQAFHLFYHHCRVVGPDPGLTAARLALTRGARHVLANGLGLMDIEAPERM